MKVLQFSVPYNSAVTLYFPLAEKFDSDLNSTPATFASGDTQYVLDGAAITNTSNLPSHEGGGVYSLSVVAGEVNGARSQITIADQNSPKTWEDTVLVIDTYGNASAAHAFDLDDNTRGSGDATAANQTTIITHLTDIKDNNGGADFSSATDSLEAIRDRGDAAWTTAASATSEFLLQSTTIATLASQTSFTLTAGSADDDAYNGALCIVTDASTSTQKCWEYIKDYTGATKTVTLRKDPGVFTMAPTDLVTVVAAPRWATEDPTGQPSSLPDDMLSFFNFMYREMFHKASIDADYRYLWDDAETGKVWKQSRTQASGEETRGTLEAGP